MRFYRNIKPTIGTEEKEKKILTRLPANNQFTAVVLTKTCDGSAARRAAVHSRRKPASTSTTTRFSFGRAPSPRPRVVPVRARARRSGTATPGSRRRAAGARRSTRGRRRPASRRHVAAWDRPQYQRLRHGAVIHSNTFYGTQTHTHTRLTALFPGYPGRPVPERYKKLSYRRGTARCVVPVKILPIATQRCRNYL